MSDGVLITLIICATLVLLSIISGLKFEYKSDKKDDIRDNKCKYPTYPRPETKWIKPIAPPTKIVFDEVIKNK